MLLPHRSASGPALLRLFNAITLRGSFYRAVAADRTGTGPAVAIVCLVSLVRQSLTLSNSPQALRAWGLAISVIALLAAIGWLVYGVFGYLLARLVSPRTPELGSMLRCLAYAETATAARLIAYAVDPSLYPLLHVAVLLWSLAAVFTAVRAAAAGSSARITLIAVPTFVVQQGVLSIEHLVAFGAPILDVPLDAQPA